MRKHTPGPWRVGDAGATVYGPRREDGGLPVRIAEVSRAPIVTGPARHNAHLIAAAPDLLDACETALALIKDHWIEDHGQADVGRVWGAIQSAIAKATGEGV